MPDAAQFEAYAKLLRLVPVETESESIYRKEPDPDAGRLPDRGWWRWPGASFVLLVVAPTLFATVYFGLMAADRYQSETRFILRVPGRSLANAAAGLATQGKEGSLAGSLGVSRAADDGYIIQSFLESRDAMIWADQHAALRAAWDAPPARYDFLWRFPNPWEPRGEEGRYRHFQRMVTSTYDGATGVSTLKVQAFSPAAAQKISTSLLVAAEALVNQLNERARRDTIGRAEQEADRLRSRLIAAQASLTTFRERERLIDPTHVTLGVLETIGRLAQEAALVSVQIGEIGTGSPNSPQLAPLRNRRAAIEAQIVQERQRLAGDARSIAPRIAEYERLMLEREFAEKALVSAMAAVEAARAESKAQEVYLERIAQPSSPDYPSQPWRVAWCLAVAFVGFVAWRAWRIVSEDTIAHASK